MFVVTNRIKVKKGFAERLAPNFTKGGEALKQFKGFVKTEVAISTNIEEYDEMSVNMFWESLDGFHEWKNSDTFKQAHKRPEPKEGEEPKESPMLGSTLVIAEIAASTEK